MGYIQVNHVYMRSFVFFRRVKLIMRQIKLAYGKNGLLLDLEPHWNVSIVEPSYLPGPADPWAALKEALCFPTASKRLGERVKSTDRVGIIFNDVTRATPTQRIVHAILAELRHIPNEKITLFNALGTHRENTPAELRRMLGDDLVDTYQIIQNNCLDKNSQVYVGQTEQGHAVWLNRELMACDLKVLTGFIEPHFFAGFSGGGKAIMPGMAGLETILGNHSAANIGDPRATWGITQGNPIWEEVAQVARMAGETFLVNVTLNRDKQITAVFAGDLAAAHAAGIEFVRASAMAPVEGLFDIVLTTNSGYPLDLNLYQTVKGMSAAAQVVKPGGTIVAAAECWDGIPEHGLFAQLLREASSPAQVLERVFSPGFAKQDQWQAQVLAQILEKAEVYVYSSYLSEEQLSSAFLKPVKSIPDVLDQLMMRCGPGARLCILPEGPVTIPYLLKKLPV
jgi:nickel-dependent lactate racemase